MDRPSPGVLFYNADVPDIHSMTRQACAGIVPSKGTIPKQATRALHVLPQRHNEGGYSTERCVFANVSAILPPTDSTIAPNQNQLFSLTTVSWLLDTRNNTTNIYIYIFFFQILFLFAKDYRMMTSG